MEYKEIENLPDDEFHELAKSQSKKFPGLLKLLTEEEIIREFYSYYKRKMPNEVFMKTGFKDPIAVKEGKKVKNPWNFDQPPYDERTSCFTASGTNYGVGHRQPVGKTKANGYAIPTGRVNTMKTDYVHKGRVSNVEVSEEE